ncbi:hypothetical protein ACOBR2_19610 [Telmatobacter bradus]|uniref:hypothetical protein n=1 Tax=Telmatobacter bradus TaxID=474953 RepID=UPI003B43B2F3
MPNTSTSNVEALARRARRESAADLNPEFSFWAGAPELRFSGDFYGQPTPNHETRLLLQWTEENLYLLFVCPYENLHLKPDPDRKYIAWQAPGRPSFHTPEVFGWLRLVD